MSRDIAHAQWPLD